MKAKTNIRTALLFATVILAASCGAGKGPKTAEPAPKAADEAALVGVAKAVYREVAHTETYSSTVTANAVNNIAPQTGSRIQKINVEVGDFVRKGQVLAEMDRLQLDQARLRLVNDSTELSRTRELYREGAVSQSDFEALELAYKVSRSSYDNLLENTILVSPVNGVVTARNYDRGDLYGMSQPIFVVQEISPVKILVGISESDYSKIRKGDQVSIKADALPGKTFSGRVNRIYPVMDAASHTVTIEVIVPNADKALRPGMYAQVEVNFGVNNSIVVPDIAIVKQQGSGQRFVFVVGEDGTVRSTAVTLGRRIGNEYEVLSGLSEGDVVVTKGSASLRNGDKVRIAE